MKNDSTYLESVGIEENIFGLDVTVGNALRVEKGDGVDKLVEDVFRGVERQRAESHDVAS